MKAIRKNARKETIKCNINQCKRIIVSYKNTIRYYNREIRQMTSIMGKYEKKLAELKALLKTKTNE